jgi:hypothetical protein
MLFDLYYTDFTTFLYLTIGGTFLWYVAQFIRNYKMLQKLKEA